MNKQDKFKCKYIKCDMDGNYCGINKGKGYNHCVLPHYQESCEYFKTTENKQIEEIAIKELANGLDITMCGAEEILTYLTKQDYQKVEKDSVVISKEEYETLLEEEKLLMGIVGKMKCGFELKEQARKETAREILQWLIEHTFESCIFEAYFKEQYGVEIKND